MFLNGFYGTPSFFEQTLLFKPNLEGVAQVKGKTKSYSPF